MGKFRVLKFIFCPGLTEENNVRLLVIYREVFIKFVNIFVIGTNVKVNDGEILRNRLMLQKVTGQVIAADLREIQKGRGGRVKASVSQR